LKQHQIAFPHFPNFIYCPPHSRTENRPEKTPFHKRYLMKLTCTSSNYIIIWIEISQHSFLTLPTSTITLLHSTFSTFTNNLHFHPFSNIWNSLQFTSFWQTKNWLLGNLAAN
jgi:hypothetical protein